MNFLSWCCLKIVINGCPHKCSNPLHYWQNNGVFPVRLCKKMLPRWRLIKFLLGLCFVQVSDTKRADILPIISNCWRISLLNFGVVEVNGWMMNAIAHWTMIAAITEKIDLPCRICFAVQMCHIYQWVWCGGMRNIVTILFKVILMTATCCKILQ